MTSFEKNVLSIHQNLYRFAFSLTNDKDKAYDLTQDTVLRLLNSKVKYQDKENFKGWAFTIMRNLFINSYRKIAKYQIVNSEYVPLENVGAFSLEEPDDVLSAKEIVKIIDKFPSEFKKPFSLYLAGYPYQEIADKIGIPLGTVKSRIFTMRERLKTIIKRGK